MRALAIVVAFALAGAAAAKGVDGFRTGLVLVVQTSGDLLSAHPHLRGLAPRGGWDGDGAWVSVPFVDPGVGSRADTTRSTPRQPATRPAT